MFNLILYIITIKYISAVSLKFRDRQDVVAADYLQEQLDVAEDCSWFKLHFTNRNHTMRIPDECLQYDFVTPVYPECDSEHFPMHCKFALRKIEIENFNSTADNSLLYVENRKRKPQIPKPNQQDPESMTKWASVAIGKAILFHADPCKPETVGKPPPRHMDCDLCWWGFIPYPCNCNCRGWNQIATLCNQPCHERGEYSFDSGAYCHKPCDGPGQLIDRVGCGFGHDRVCVDSSGDCAKRWISRAVDMGTVLATLVPGVNGVKGAWSTATKVAKSAKGASAGLLAAKAAIRETARVVKNKFKDTVTMTNAFTYLNSQKEAIIQEAAIRFLTSNLPNDDTNYALEIAALADPTGIVSLVKGWIPPDDCEAIAVCSHDKCEAITDTPPIIDECTPYGGILFSYHNRVTCCAQECGDYCGAQNCQLGTGRPKGEFSCCRTSIPQNDVCGRNGQVAPCHMPTNQCTPYRGQLISSNHKVSCCDGACGHFCGASNCNEGPGGRTSCCVPDIPEDKICGQNGEMAPCHVPTDECTPYDGTLKTWDNKVTCCAAGCGNYCGAPNCEDGPGGSEACCVKDIAEDNICGTIILKSDRDITPQRYFAQDGQKAPCHIAQNECTPYGGQRKQWAEDNLLSKTKITCCPKECGSYCGAQNCNEGPETGGICCVTQIPKDDICGRDGQVAPCHMPKPGCTDFPGYLTAPLADDPHKGTISESFGVPCTWLALEFLLHFEEPIPIFSSWEESSQWEPLTCEDSSMATSMHSKDGVGVNTACCGCGGGNRDQCSVYGGVLTMFNNKMACCVRNEYNVVDCPVDIAENNICGPLTVAPCYFPGAHNMCENWKIGNECNGEAVLFVDGESGRESVLDVGLSEAECMLACEENPSCGCVTWGVNPNAKCRLTTGPGSHPGQSSSKACELGEKCKNWRIGQQCNGDVIGEDMDLPEGRCLSACKKHEDCSCVTWGVDPNKKCRLQKGFSTVSGQSSWKACHIASYFALPKGAARCLQKDPKISSLDECEKAAEILGFNFLDSTTITTWKQPCGCHFNVETNNLQFNKFQHLCYCWNQGCGKKQNGTDVIPTQHMKKQNKNAIDYKPICKR